MPRAKVRWILVCSTVAVLMLAAVVLVCWRSTSEPVEHLPISLLGTSNDPMRGLVASFSVTNESQMSISYCICPVQVKSDGAWPALQIPHSGGTELASGKADVFSVAAPVAAQEWRVPVVWGYRPTGVRSVAGTVKYNLRLNWHLLRHGRFPRLSRSSQFTMYASYSPTVPK